MLLEILGGAVALVLVGGGFAGWRISSSKLSAIQAYLESEEIKAVADVKTLIANLKAKL
jgi:hypothetical protein